MGSSDPNGDQSRRDDRTRGKLLSISGKWAFRLRR